MPPIIHAGRPGTERPCSQSMNVKKFFACGCRWVGPAERTGRQESSLEPYMKMRNGSSSDREAGRTGAAVSDFSFVKAFSMYYRQPFTSRCFRFDPAGRLVFRSERPLIHFFAFYAPKARLLPPWRGGL
ncbi:uncharacterized protein Dmul_31210 [Desulfococcus multivorans]|nr:uncharacterized protein Dmul_31210 [Desulfococcus multivorans]